MKIAFGSEQVCAPDLPPVPDTAISILCDEVKRLQADDRQILLVGSSLGGYYSAWLSDRFDLPAILVNPSVKPYTTLRLGLGLNPTYTAETRFFIFTREHLESLRNYEAPQVKSDKLLLMLQTGDAILDYREALDRFPQAERLVIEGGSHGFDRFEDYMGVIRQFYWKQYGKDPISPMPDPIVDKAIALH